jgi:hypothetical protein
MTNDPEWNWGECPVCGTSEGHLNVGRSHWFYCKEHKVKWCIGWNLFSTWRDQTEEEQRKIYDEVGMGGFRRIEFHEACLNPT